MGRDAKVEWLKYTTPDGEEIAGATYNEWLGCTKISPACKMCYAEAMQRRFKKAKWGRNATRVRVAESTQQAPYAWNSYCQRKNNRMRVFCNSSSDVFEENPTILPEWRTSLFKKMEACNLLDWLVLTKRPENVLKMVPPEWIENWPSNVWIGTTVEDQRRVNERMPHMASIPAPVRFLSCEPLLEEIDLSTYLSQEDQFGNQLVHWVIVGGESGNGARYMAPGWVKKVYEDCKDSSYDVRYFFKQTGSNEARMRRLGNSKGADLSELPGAAEFQTRESPSA